MRRVVGSIFAALLVLGACRGGLPPDPPVPGPTVIEVTTDEYRFEYDATSVAKGRVVFQVQNAGELEHELVLVPLPEGLSPLNEQLRSTTRRSLGTLAHLPALSPGDEGTFAVELIPGRYGIMCFLRGDDGIQHVRKGMATEFRLD